MKEELKRFSEALASDKDLENELKTVMEKAENPKDRIAAGIVFANAKGYGITEEDLVPDGQKLDLDELDNMAGGSCGCFVSGGGCGTDDETNNRYDCICCVDGEGFTGAEKNSIQFTNDSINCFCIFAGGGTDGCKVNL